MKKKSLILGASLIGVVASASLALADVNQPQEIIMRPLTTPGSQITVGGDLVFPINPDAFDFIGLNLGGSYGVDDKIEVGAAYFFALKDFEAKGDLGVQAAYNIMEGNLSVAADVATGYDLVAEGMDNLDLGARIRFRLNDQLAITSPGGQLSIALDGDPKPITLGLPVGVAMQVSPQLYAFVNTELANISISNSETVVFGSDYIPLSVGAFFSPSNTMDFGAAVGWFDLKESSDFIIGSVSARLHM
jgi:hypothetical protein